MKLILILAVLASTLLICECAFQTKDEISNSLAAYEKFLRATTRNGTSAKDYGCCPVIVRNCEGTGTVIEPFTGWRGNVAAIIDWGCTEWTPCNCTPKGRPCTSEDKNFIWYVNWGDNDSDFGRMEFLGPFQVTHQYKHIDRWYRVTVMFCSDPPGSQDRCCDSIYKYIYVQEDLKLLQKTAS